MSLSAQVFVVTGGVGALGVTAYLVRDAFTPGERSRRTSIAIGACAVAAFAGVLKCCHDLLAHRELWRGESTIPALLNFLGIIMVNSFALTLVTIGRICLQHSRPAAGTGMEPGADRAGAD